MSAPIALKMERPIRKERMNEYLLRTARLQGCKDSKRSYMRGSFSTNRRVRVQSMSEMTEKDIAEALRNMERANRAMARIFNMEEEENE
jgi:hypothetical protein